jgi:hypothetical protein
MKLALAVALLLGSTAHADPANAVVHVALSDGGQYDLTVSRSGTATSLTARDGNEAIELHLRIVDGGKLRYEIKRSGARPFSLEGETLPPRAKPAVIGHVPFGANSCDVRLRMTDD